MKFLLPFVVCVLFSTGTETDWKTIVQQHKFTETKSKRAIPRKVWKSIGVKRYSQVANPGKRWNPGCVILPGVPSSSLVWAASDSCGNWIIELREGGFASHTAIYFASIPEGLKTIDHQYPLGTDSSFAAFRERYFR